MHSDAIQFPPGDTCHVCSSYVTHVFLDRLLAIVSVVLDALKKSRDIHTTLACNRGLPIIKQSGNKLESIHIDGMRIEDMSGR